MSPSKLASLLLLLTLLWASALSSAQAAVPSDIAQSSDAALLRQLGQAGGDPQIARHAETGKARFLEAGSSQPLWRSNSLIAATPEQVSRAFLSIYGPLFGLQGQERELALMQQQQVSGRNFVRFQQMYQGIPILAGEIIVQTNQQRAVISANGEVMPDLNVATQPSVAADVATQTALAAVAKLYQLEPADLRPTTPQLWIYNPALLGGPGLRISRLVWRMEVSAPGAAQPVRELVLVDALRGNIALHFNQVAHAKQRIVCDDKNVVDSDGNQDNNCVPANYARVEGQGPTGNPDVDDAYDYAGATYDYFLNNFGRDSLDGKGLPLISLVRYCPDSGNCPYQNANWDGHQMTYGAGFASGDDVVGHELTHGFTDFTSHLLYYYQSGAINESLSDVFGELIDQTDGLGTDVQDNWELGEDLPASIGVIRDMSDPPRFGHPDRMTSFNYTGDSSDNGGVHSNSGVNNKAAFLMTDGGTFNGQTISGLGPAKVGAIYYTLEVAFLTSGSVYQDLFVDLPAACDALAASGAYGINDNNCDQVRKAVIATEMDTTPPAAPVPEAQVCAPGQTSQDVFFDDLENPASGNWATAATQGQINEWFYPTENNPYSALFDGKYATSGTQNFWGNDQGNDPSSNQGSAADYNIAMTRDIALPANAFLHFRHAFDFEDDGSGLGFEFYDGGVVEYSTNAGATWNDAGTLFSSGGGQNGYNVTLTNNGDNPLKGRNAFGSISQGYYSSRADLSSLAGQSVRFRFRIGTDSFNDYSADPSRALYGWFIDDIRLYRCGATPPVASLVGGSATIAENGGSIAVQLKLSGVTDQAVSVPFTVSGSASEGSDYRLTGHSIIVPAGSASGRVVIEVTNDQLEEPAETVILTLGTPTNATLGAVTQATVTIVDNDHTYLRYVPLLRK
jgi:Zn-dependent metalloprotease